MWQKVTPNYWCVYYDEHQRHKHELLPAAVNYCYIGKPLNSHQSTVIMHET